MMGGGDRYWCGVRVRGDLDDCMGSWGAAYINSLSQFPISPPVFQKGRYMPTKSPHFLSCRAFLKAFLPMECVLMTVNFLCSSA